MFFLFLTTVYLLLHPPVFVDKTYMFGIFTLAVKFDSLFLGIISEELKTWYFSYSAFWLTGQWGGGAIWLTGMQLLRIIETHLKLLQENFEKYFTAKQTATLDANS